MRRSLLISAVVLLTGAVDAVVAGRDSSVLSGTTWTSTTLDGGGGPDGSDEEWDAEEQEAVAPEVGGEAGLVGGSAHAELA